MHPAMPSTQWRHRFATRAASAVAGQPRIRRLTLTHAINDFADGLINISLLGSLFLSVSLEASRDRILLYLLLAVAPLALIAPAVGPLLERTRAGYRSIMIGSHVIRAFTALLLAGSLKTPAFYPLVFVVLLSRKAYVLARTALLPQLVPQSDRLADASGHISRIGTIAGGIGTGLGGLLIVTAGAPALPAVAAAAFVAAALVTRRVPAGEARPRVGPFTVRTAAPPSVRRAGIAVSAMRAANGALAYLLALAIKRGGSDTWVFAVALVAAGVGSYVGTLITGALHRRVGAHGVVGLVLLVPGVVTLFSVLAAGELSIIAVAFTIGLGSSVATRTMDALYAQVPDIARARTISANELRFQLSNVCGAVFAVMLTPSPKVGFLVVALLLLTSGALYASQQKLEMRRGATALLMGRQLYSTTRSLPRTLFDEAVVQGRQGANRLAVVTAHASIRSAIAHGAEPPEEWPPLQAQVDDVLAGSPATAEFVDAMLAIARLTVAQLEPDVVIPGPV